MLGATVWLYYSHDKTTLGARAGIGWPEPAAQVTQDSAQDTLSQFRQTLAPPMACLTGAGTYKGSCHTELEDDLDCGTGRGGAEKDVNRLPLSHKASRTPVLAHGTTYWRPTCSPQAQGRLRASFDNRLPRSEEGYTRIQPCPSWAKSQLPSRGRRWRHQLQHHSCSLEMWPHGSQSLNA